jgi:hypothetical protein
VYSFKRWQFVKTGTFECPPQAYIDHVSPWLCHTIRLTHHYLQLLTEARKLRKETIESIKAALTAEIKSGTFSDRNGIITALENGTLDMYNPTTSVCLADTP